VRVVAGLARGRRLEAPPGRGTRPTLDRVREAVLNALGSMGVVEGARVLDLFAGSGALGIEALSRGAAEATFVDDDRRAVGAVRANLATTGLAGAATVVRDDALGFLRRGAGPFDVAFCDPPYAFDGWTELGRLLDAGVVVVESDREVDLGGGWSVERTRRYGDTLVTMARRTRGSGRHERGARVSTTVLYPGSFDPFHNGHREIVETASYLFDTVVVAAIRNPQKGEPLFSLDERKDMIAESLAHLDNIKITQFSSLVVNLARDVGADFIIKGLRAPSDFESEMAQAQMNLAVSGVHTIFLPSASANSFIASKFVRDIARFGGDVSGLVPEAVLRRLKEKLGG